MNITGTVENIVFRNSDNGYTVLDLDSKGEMITCVGYFPIISEGEEVNLNGEFKVNSRYGNQFVVSEAFVKPPESLSAIKRYLSSGLIKGVGPVTSEAIVNTFGKDTLQVIEFNPSLLAQVKGISKHKAEEISSSFADIKKMQNAVMFLQKYDISLNLAMRIYDVYHGRTEEAVRRNPYRLVEDIDGVGFLTADRLAQKMGIPPNSGFRVRAGVSHILKETAEKNGNTFIPKFFLNEGLEKLLGQSVDEKLTSVLEDMQLEGVVKLFEYEDAPAVALARFYNTEQSIASRMSLLSLNQNETSIDVKSQISLFEQTNNIKFHEDQIKAIETAISSGVSVLTGGPGTGKTTIVKCICSILKDARLSFLLLAPTGRAAKRLSESTGIEAKTIHRGLEVDPTSNRTRFMFNEQNKLQFDAVIVDEVSMVDCVLFNSLLKALRHGAKLILVGDKDQLPSVSAGNVLADIIASDVIAKHNLTHIFRQSEDSQIVTNAHLINKGEMPVLDNSSKDFFYDKTAEPADVKQSVISMVTSRIPKFLNTDPKNIQVLAPMKVGVAGVDNLNKELQDKLNPASLKKAEIVLEHTTFRVGDRVMQTVNNYNQEWVKYHKTQSEFGSGVFNGDIGEVKQVNTQSGEVVVHFEDGRIATYVKGDLRDLILAYAITVHKSQGCEFDVVVLPIVSGPHIIFTRNLLYTAVTRAKKMVVLCGSKMNISRMVRNNYTAKRFSLLKGFLKEKYSEVEKLYN